jgi:hypothetical protein
VLSKLLDHDKRPILSASIQNLEMRVPINLCLCRGSSKQNTLGAHNMRHPAPQGGIEVVNWGQCLGVGRWSGELVILGGKKLVQSQAKSCG